jgi:hypothetical protein
MINKKNRSVARNEGAYPGFICHSTSNLSEQEQVDKLVERHKKIIVEAIKELNAKKKF